MKLTHHSPLLSFVISLVAVMIPTAGINSGLGGADSVLRKGWEHWLRAKERQAGTGENCHCRCPDLLWGLTVKKYLLCPGDLLGISHRLLRTFHSAQEQNPMNQIPWHWKNQGKVTQDNEIGYKISREIFKDENLVFHWILKSFRLEGAFKSIKSKCSAWFSWNFVSQQNPFLE